MSLISAGQSLQEMRTDMERIEDVMKYPSDVTFEESDDENVEYDKLSGKIEIKNITFGYSRLAEPLIKDFSMTLAPGSRVAFVGPSGCGKSTISKLISGLYKPWSGEILFDGKPASKIDRSVFTGSLAVVDQDIILFEDTIANNIKMWDNSIEDFEMIMAARDAQLHEDIMQREGGYQYRLTEGGKNFSGGQRQRMEIARVLAQDPTIIIFVYAPALVVPALIIILVTVVFSVVSSLVQMKLSIRRMELSGKEDGMTYALITGIQKIKLAGAEKRAFARWGNLYAENARLASSRKKN